MRRTPLLVASILLGISLFLSAVAAVVQAAQPEDASIDTLDRVRLRGVFAPGKAKAPCVILLHNIGGKRTDKGWKELIEALAKKEYAVLSLDFRGHGDSTLITKPETFWMVQANKNFVKYHKDTKDRIEKIDKADYKPMLVSDIAAARRFLEENAAGNIGNIVLIGAEEGAAVGALWLATEWQRRPSKKFNNGFAEYWAPDLTSDFVEGEDIACCVWLTMPERFAQAKVSSWLANKYIRDKVPMAFFCGSKDRTAVSSADRMVEEIKKGGKKEDLEFTTVRKKSTDAKGAQLLLKDGTIDDIISYIDKCVDKREPSSRKRELSPDPPVVNLTGFVRGW